MLVLSRRTDERIMIGNDIVITVLEIHHDHVRIGIDAPRSIDVHREEVFRLIQSANVAAADDSGGDRLESLFAVSSTPEAQGAASVARLKRSPVAREASGPKKSPPEPKGTEPKGTGKTRP